MSANSCEATFRDQRTGAAREELPQEVEMKGAKRDEAILRAFALSYPDAHEDFPWGERVIKVKSKVFVFMGVSDGGLGVSVKLPVSATLALGLPFATPTRYGLGKSGWVTARFAPKERVPLDVLRQWIDESYRAVAPKKLVAGLLARPFQPTATHTRARRG